MLPRKSEACRPGDVPKQRADALSLVPGGTD